MALDLLALGEAIRDLRQHHGLTQVQMADCLGITHFHVNRIEHGGRTPSLDMLDAIAARLDVPLAFLIVQASQAKGRHAALIRRLQDVIALEKDT